MPTVPLNTLTDLWSSDIVRNAIRMTASEAVTITDSNLLMLQLSAVNTGPVDKFTVNRNGVVSTGSWSASAINVFNGGTGATDPTTARGNLQLVIGTDIASQTAVDARLLLAGGTLTGALTISSGDLTISAGGITASNTLVIGTAGSGVNIKEGSDARMGIATLTGGTVTVSTTVVTANSRIFLTGQNLGTITVPVGYAVSARTAGTSFTILSADVLDTSDIAWIIMEPAA